MPKTDSSPQTTLPDGTTLRAVSVQQTWDRVITPQRKLFTLPVAEVWRSRYLLYLFVRRDFVAFYKQTILGPFWFFLQPLLTSLIYMLVFSRIAGLSTDGVPPLLFYLTGVTCWNYFADCFIKTSETFTANASLFGKVAFPRLLVPLSIVISNLVKFIIQLLLLAVVWLWYVYHGDVQPHPSLLLAPVIIALMAAIGLGAGLIFSAMTTKYRDLRFLIQFGTQLLMYATPVIYPLSMIEGRLRQFMAYNPLATLLESFRYGFLGTGEVSTPAIAWTAFACVSTLAVGLIMFNQSEKTFIDSV